MNENEDYLKHSNFMSFKEAVYLKFGYVGNDKQFKHIVISHKLAEEKIL